jgi:hypothetical protein
VPQNGLNRRQAYHGLPAGFGHGLAATVAMPVTMTAVVTAAPVVRLFPTAGLGPIIAVAAAVIRPALAMVIVAFVPVLPPVRRRPVVMVWRHEHADCPGNPKDHPEIHIRPCGRRGKHDKRCGDRRGTRPPENRS